MLYVYKCGLNYKCVGLQKAKGRGWELGHSHFRSESVHAQDPVRTCVCKEVIVQHLGTALTSLRWTLYTVISTGCPSLSPYSPPTKAVPFFFTASQ